MSFIAIDWGSTNFRAYRVEAGELQETINSPLGITQLTEGTDFDSVLCQELAPWRQQIEQQQIPIIIAGMIGSDRGWLDSGYQMLPLTVEQIANGCVPLTCSLDTRVYLRPGIAQTLPVDVMRGEEVQLLGALQLVQADWYVFPGTHSKWVHPHSEPGKLLSINHFNTVMTGELYHVLINHSLLGYGAADVIDQQAYLDGVEQGFLAGAQIIEQLFFARASRVLKLVEPTYTAGWLSGLLIGHEIATHVAPLPDHDFSVAIIAGKQLAELYAQACALKQLNCTIIDAEQATIQGFRSIYATL